MQYVLIRLEDYNCLTKPWVYRDMQVNNPLQDLCVHVVQTSCEMKGGLCGCRILNFYSEPTLDH